MGNCRGNRGKYAGRAWPGSRGFRTVLSVWIMKAPSSLLTRRPSSQEDAKCRFHTHLHAQLPCAFLVPSVRFPFPPRRGCSARRLGVDPSDVAARPRPQDLRPRSSQWKADGTLVLNPPRASHCETLPQKENLQDPPSWTPLTSTPGPSPAHPLSPAHPPCTVPSTVCPHAASSA